MDHGDRLQTCEKQLSQSFARGQGQRQRLFRANRLSRHANAAMVEDGGARRPVFRVVRPHHQRHPAACCGCGFCLVMGIGMAGIGFAVTHDALHGAYSGNPRVNRLIGCFSTRLEPTATSGKSPTITSTIPTPTSAATMKTSRSSPLIRLSPHTPLKPIHRFQPLFAFIACCMATLFWVFVKDYKYFLQRDLGPYHDKKHPCSSGCF